MQLFVTGKQSTAYKQLHHARGPHENPLARAVGQAGFKLCPLHAQPCFVKPARALGKQAMHYSFGKICLTRFSAVKVLRGKLRQEET
jgi:hypothetical protein